MMRVIIFWSYQTLYLTGSESIIHYIELFVLWGFSILRFYHTMWLDFCCLPVSVSLSDFCYKSDSTGIRLKIVCQMHTD